MQKYNSNNILSNEVISSIMNYLPIDQIQMDIFAPYYSTHIKLRDSVEKIKNVDDYLKLEKFPNIKYDISLNFEPVIFLLGDEKIKNIVKLYTLQYQIKIPPKLINLIHLDCSYTGVEEIPTELVNLIHLDCSYTHVKIIPDNFINLKKLITTNSYITKIPDSFVKLEELECKFNSSITTISEKFSNLKSLECPYTGIYEIPNTLVNLESLNIAGTHIKKIPRTIINLHTLHCDSSSIFKISSNLINLKNLTVTNNTFVPKHIRNILENYEEVLVI